MNIPRFISYNHETEAILLHIAKCIKEAGIDCAYGGVPYTMWVVIPGHGIDHNPYINCVPPIEINIRDGVIVVHLEPDSVSQIFDLVQPDLFDNIVNYVKEQYAKIKTKEAEKYTTR